MEGVNEDWCGMSENRCETSSKGYRKNEDWYVTCNIQVQNK